MRKERQHKAANAEGLSKMLRKHCYECKVIRTGVHGTQCYENTRANQQEKLRCEDNVCQILPDHTRANARIAAIAPALPTGSSRPPEISIDYAPCVSMHFRRRECRIPRTSYHIMFLSRHVAAIRALWGFGFGVAVWV